MVVSGVGLPDGWDDDLYEDEEEEEPKPAVKKPDAAAKPQPPFSAPAFSLSFGFAQVDEDAEMGDISLLDPEPAPGTGPEAGAGTRQS